MSKLTAGTVVTHPDSGLPTFLAEGVEVPEWADGLIGDHLLVEDAPASDVGGYANALKADLLQLIADRNADRDDEHKITPASDKNADLIAALESDDAAASDA